MKKGAENLGLLIIGIGEGKELGAAKDIITDSIHHNHRLIRKLKKLFI